jgi:hypothetical protein
MNPVFESLTTFFERGSCRARMPASAAMWSLAPSAAMRREIVAYGNMTAAAEMLERDQDAMDRHLGPAQGNRWERLPAVEVEVRARSDRFGTPGDNIVARRRGTPVDGAVWVLEPVR